jgi:hypothetical protein
MKLEKDKHMKYIIYLILLIIVSCGDYGHRSMSRSIEESKERNVFIAEYKPVSNPVIINDTLKLDIIACWLEKQWSQISYNDFMEIDGYQLTLEVAEKKQLKRYSYDWVIGTHYKGLFRPCSRTAIMTDFDSLPNNVLNYDVFIGEDNILERDSALQNRKIGKLTLVN